VIRGRVGAGRPGNGNCLSDAVVGVDTIIHAATNAGVTPEAATLISFLSKTIIGHDDSVDVQGTRRLLAHHDTSHRIARLAGNTRAEEKIVGMPLPGKAARALRQGKLICPNGERGTITWTEWLRRSYVRPVQAMKQFEESNL